jgi:hypothetical protein
MQGNLIARLADAENAALIDRRSALTAGGAMAGLLASAATGVGAIRSAAADVLDVKKLYPHFDWDDPATNQRILSRMFGTLEPGKIGYLYFFGRGVGTTGPDDYQPLFRLESLAASQAFPQPNGSVRYKAGQIILFCDWATGDVIDSWKNPYTGETCEVFHYRDHPLDYVMDPNKVPERYSDPTDITSRRLVMPWSFRSDRAYGDAFVKTKIKNRLDAKVWKRESIGEYWTTYEHYQWQAPIADIVNPDIQALYNMNGDFQTFKPFEPWMLMGQRPGKVFQQKTMLNIPNFDPVPRKIMAYVEKHMAQYLDLSAIPQNAYKLNDAHYAEQRKPMP